MIDDKSNPPAAVRKTLKLGLPKAAVAKPVQPAAPVPRPAASAAASAQHMPKSGRGGGPADWADAHKRRMQADMDALMDAPAATRR